jgi:GMP synthase (glutamine-hydrolysing)
MKDKERVLIIQNDQTENLCLYQRYLEERDISHHIVHAYEMHDDYTYTPVSDFDAFIIGPTPIPANVVEQHGFLRKEWNYLKEIVESKKPCLGVCCGGQILARVLGAEVVKSPTKELGGYDVKLTEAGKRDPLLKGFPETFPVYQWHTDMFKVPRGGEQLVEGFPCPIQAYGWKNVKGLLFHLEIDGREASRWADTYSSELTAAGKSREQVLNECVEREPEMRRLAYLLMDNLLSLSKE